MFVSRGNGPTSMYQDRLGTLVSLANLDLNVAADTINYNNYLPGGSTDQILAKASAADFDVEWQDKAPGTLPIGGTTGQAMRKQSATDYDAGWANVNEVPSGGASGSVLRKSSATNYDAAWDTLDADDIADTSTTHKFTTAADISKLAGIEEGATAEVAATTSTAGITAYSNNAQALARSSTTTALTPSNLASVLPPIESMVAWRPVIPTITSYTGTSASVDAYGTITLSAVSAINFNACYTSDAEDYLWVITLTSTTAAADFQYQARTSGGTTLTSASYDYGRYDVSTSPAGTNTTGGTYIPVVRSNGANGCHGEVYVTGSALSQYTWVHGWSRDTAFFRHIGGSVSNTTQYTGATFKLGTGNGTGRMRLYKRLIPA